MLAYLSTSLQLGGLAEAESVSISIYIITQVAGLKERPAAAESVSISIYIITAGWAGCLAGWLAHWFAACLLACLLAWLAGLFKVMFHFCETQPGKSVGWLLRNCGRQPRSLNS